MGSKCFCKLQYVVPTHMLVVANTFGTVPQISIYAKQLFIIFIFCQKTLLEMKMSLHAQYIQMRVRSIFVLTLMPIPVDKK